MKYQDLLNQYDSQVKELTRQYNIISRYRLAVVGLFIFLLVSLLKVGSNALWLGLFLSVVLFIWLLKKHQKIAQNKLMAETLRRINKDEIDFLSEIHIPFEDGVEFVDPQHVYSYDLDVFGRHSLFQYLNRTTTYRGKVLLAESLKKALRKPEILINQEAVDELSPAITLRQKIRALGLIGRDSKEHYNFLLRWSAETGSLSKTLMFATYFLRFLLLVAMVFFAVTGTVIWLNAVTLIYIANIVLLGSHLKEMKAQLSGLETLDSVIKHYGLMLDELKFSQFKASKLRELNDKINEDNILAGDRLKSLAILLNQLDSVYNGVAVMLFSGTFCYHLHVLRRLYQWRAQNADRIEIWLEVIAEFEKLSSFSNLKYNNPEFIFPEISDKAELRFEELGHPLVSSPVRVCNDIDFNKHRFVILTGSNMSGKSTFLRSIGVNMVLAGVGSVICSRSAKLFPFQVLVSMRVADSLAENESYFYAEVKRLKQITDQLKNAHSLVLLDEILRGTNSDDKRNGTLEVIRRMVREEAYGIIATHDLEICKETENHPDTLCNKCFEVEIINDELYFDYKLRDGICVNQSATFLMKKTGII
ncbi:MAG: DNA mismatch repair protein MutS [Saprospiraceae bacterium]|nr:DNA mismatch repair protein MutS [Saprospiraceae bacterium]